MIIIRLITWLLILIGIGMLVLDIVVSIDAHHWEPTSFAQLWAHLSPSNLQTARELLGDRVLDFWGAPLLIAMGGLLHILSVVREAPSS